MGVRDVLPVLRNMQDVTAEILSNLMCDFQLHEEKIAAIQEKLELAEQKLAQYSKLPEIEEQLKQRMEALTQVRPQVRGSQLTLIYL